MSLLAAPALAMLIAAAVLVALAALHRGPSRRDVGTLLIWQRIARQAHAERRRRISADLLFWLLLAGIVIGAIGAARPAWLQPARAPTVAVFIERLQPGATEPGLDEVRERARAEAPGARIEFFLPGQAPDADVKTLHAGSIQAELAQFATRSRDADARLLFLASPAPGAVALGRVMPRVSEPRNGVTFAIDDGQGGLVVKASPGGAPTVSGARLESQSRLDGVAVYNYQPTSKFVSVRDAAGNSYELRRKPFVVGVGDDWQGPAHRALYEALGADGADEGEPAVWLGNDKDTPALRVNRGGAADLSGATLSYDPGHPLFHELPIESFDWLADGRLLPPEDGARPLLSAVRNGERIGDLARLRGKVLEFAGDPFTHGPVASAALLLDNSIGVLTGERPSERKGYELAGDARLPTQRAARAAPFEPAGNLDLSSASGREASEFTTWLTLAAGLLLLAAAALVLRE